MPLFSVLDRRQSSIVLLSAERRHTEVEIMESIQAVEDIYKIAILIQEVLLMSHMGSIFLEQQLQ
jgi:hypothetical protein